MLQLGCEVLAAVGVFGGEAVVAVTAVVPGV